MKTNHLSKTFLTALLLAAVPFASPAASLLADGNFDNLPVGTAPNVGAPAGHWFWPADYPSDVKETAASQFSIAPAPAGGIGNALRLSFATSESPGMNIHLPNILARRVTAASGQILNVMFDVYVEPGAPGPSIYVGKGGDPNTDRAAQLLWLPGAALQVSTNPNGPWPTLLAYPRGVWQSIRLELDVARARYNFHWSEKGQPISVTKTNLAFQSGAIPYIDRFTVVRYDELGLGNAQASVDNIQVTTDPVITPRSLDLVVGGTATLAVVNLPSGEATFQWQRNGQAIAGATAATLELSDIAGDHAGEYKVVITTAGQSFTTEASTVRVFDQLTLTTPPEKTEATPGKTTGFAVAALGPLPMTFQWRFQGADLPGMTNRFLTFKASEATAGDYSVVVSDANGSVVSPQAKLTVLAKPAFVQAPLSQSVVAGGSVTFSARITGIPAPFTYQWRKGSTFANSTILAEVQSAAKTAFLTLTNVQPADAGTYRLYLANPAAPSLTSTSPNRSFTLNVLPDTDGDGLPDEWETANALNPASSADAMLDSDGDGQSNLAEYQAGTVPASTASALRIEAVTQVNGQATVTFTAAANKTYTVEWKENPAGDTWEKLADIVAQATDRMETVTDPAAGAVARFYRVVTPRRP